MSHQTHHFLLSTRDLSKVSMAVSIAIEVARFIMILSFQHHKLLYTTMHAICIATP